MKVFNVFLDGFNSVCGADPFDRGRPCDPTATSSSRPSLWFEVPQIQFIGRAWTFLFVPVHTVQKTVEIPQVLFLEVGERPLLCDGRCDWVQIAAVF